MFKVCLHNNCISHANFSCPLVIANKREAVYTQATFRSTAMLRFTFNNKLSIASYDPLKAFHLQRNCQIQNRLLTKYEIQTPINPTPRPYVRVTWMYTCKGVQVCTVYPVAGYYGTRWLTGLWSTQERWTIWGRYLAIVAWHWGSASSVVNDPLGEPGRTPFYVGLPSERVSVDGDYMFSPHFVGGLRFGDSDRYK